MSRKRRRLGAALKAKVALAAVRGDKTTAQLASQFSVHTSQVTAWKKRLLEGVTELFADGRGKASENGVAKEQELYEQIGRLKMEVEWLKKSRSCWTEPTGVTDMDRSGTQLDRHRAAVRTGWFAEEQLLLPAPGRDGREPGADATHRRGLHPVAVLRITQAGVGTRGQSQARSAVDAADGHRGGGRQASHDEASSRTPDLSVFAAESPGRASRCKQRSENVAPAVPE